MGAKLRVVLDRYPLECDGIEMRNSFAVWFLLVACTSGGEHQEVHSGGEAVPPVTSDAVAEPNAPVTSEGVAEPDSPRDQSGSICVCSEAEEPGADYGSDCDSESPRGPEETCEAFCGRSTGDPCCYGNGCSMCVDDCSA